MLLTKNFIPTLNYIDLTKQVFDFTVLSDKINEDIFSLINQDIIEEINFLCEPKQLFNDTKTNNKNPTFSDPSFQSNFLINNNFLLLNHLILFYGSLYLKNLNVNKKIKISKSWVTFHKSRCVSDVHNHPPSLLSGVVYINVIDSYNQGMLRFYKSLDHDTYDKNNFLDFKPKTGSIIIFPGLAFHSITENKTNDTRISLSFQINEDNEA